MRLENLPDHVGSFPDGENDPCPYMASRLSRRQAVSQTAWISLLLVKSTNPICNTNKKLSELLSQGSGHLFKLLLRGKILPDKRNLLKILRSSFLTVLCLLNMINFEFEYCRIWVKIHSDCVILKAIWLTEDFSAIVWLYNSALWSEVFK